MDLFATHLFMRSNYTRDEYLLLIRSCNDLDLLRLIKDQFSEDRSNGLIDAIDGIDVASELAVRIIDLKIEKGILDEEED